MYSWFDVYDETRGKCRALCNLVVWSIWLWRKRELPESKISKASVTNNVQHLGNIILWNSAAAEVDAIKQFLLSALQVPKGIAARANVIQTNWKQNL